MGKRREASPDHYSRAEAEELYKKRERGGCSRRCGRGCSRKMEQRRSSRRRRRGERRTRGADGEPLTEVREQHLDASGS